MIIVWGSSVDPKGDLFVLRGRRERESERKLGPKSRWKLLTFILTFLLDTMGNTQTTSSSRVPVTEHIQEDAYSNDSVPRTPVRGASSQAAFDPRSPSAPRTPVSQDAPAADPRSPMPASRTPMKPLDMNTAPSETQKKQKPKPFNFSVSGASNASTAQVE
jgi:hypothetical protein